MANEINFSGGRVYFERLQSDGITYDPEVEIGLVQSFSVTGESTKITLKDYSDGIGVDYDEVVSELIYSGSLETANVNSENLAFAFFGETETRTYDVGDQLPDGTTVAGTAVTLNLVKAGTVTNVKGRLKFVGAPVVGKNEIWQVKKVNMAISGDLPIISTDDYRKLTFDIGVLKDDTAAVGTSPYFEIYDMDSVA